MTTEQKKKTADTLQECSSWLRIGLLFIHVKPLTLGQIYEIGTYTNQMTETNLDLKAKVVATAEMFARFGDAKLMQEIFLVSVFRTRWKRFIFRRYILKKLTVSKFQKAMEVITNAYTANFFLTSIIFLRQTTKITEPNPMIAHGQQWEE